MTGTIPVKKLKAGLLDVSVYNNRAAMGAAAARDVALKIRELQVLKSFVNIIFAAAPSQNEFLAALVIEDGIDWSRVNGFHMDEYAGIDRSSPQSFAYFIKERIADKVSLHQMYYLDGNAADAAVECDRYRNLLLEYPADIVCMGIGENTHIAFNDPHTADFNDPFLVKVVTLEQASREQQVHDGCFSALNLVPTTAITLTVPALINAKAIYCIVPGPNKATAVYQTIHQDESELYPATSLKKHPAAKLYVDQDSASLVA